MERTKVIGETIIRHRHSVDTYPPELRKKVILLEHFSQHLLSASKKNYAEVTGSDENRTGSHHDLIFQCKRYNMDYVRKWHRLEHAIIFRFDNNVVQVQFFDSTQLVISNDSKTLMYINKDGSRESHRVEHVINKLVGIKSNIRKRYLYANEIQDFVKMKNAPTA
jgi:polo-like kinase 1